jgi:hypothetical protein
MSEMMTTDPKHALTAGSPALAVLMISLGRVVVTRLVAGPLVLTPSVRRRRGSVDTEPV